MCKDDFIVSPYVIEDDVPRTQLPEWGPRCAGLPGECNIKEHSKRERSTGPCHPLIIALCKAHHSYFTIYPEGFHPYSRATLEPPFVEEEQSQSSINLAWSKTLFWAAYTAASGMAAWTREANGKSGWHTQCRQILSMGRWLGLTREQGWQAAMTALGVELLPYMKAQKAFIGGGFRARGRAIMEVLEAMSRDGAILLRLLKAGQMTGMCGQAFFWPPCRGQYPLRN